MAWEVHKLVATSSYSSLRRDSPIPFSASSASLLWEYRGTLIQRSSTGGYMVMNEQGNSFRTRRRLMWLLVISGQKQGLEILTIDLYTI